jgi:transcription initiation factor TFIID subunit TAF12
MKKLSVIALLCTAFLYSCNKHKDDYKCITVTSNNYIVTRIDTTVQTDFTSKQARDYENANTSHGAVGNSTPGDTKATTCTQIL